MPSDSLNAVFSASMGAVQVCDCYDFTELSRVFNSSPRDHANAVDALDSVWLEEFLFTERCYRKSTVLTRWYTPHAAWSVHNISIMWRADGPLI